VTRSPFAKVDAAYTAVLEHLLDSADMECARYGIPPDEHWAMEASDALLSVVEAHGWTGPEFVDEMIRRLLDGEEEVS